MTRVIVAVSPDAALEDGLWALHTGGIKQDSRNGPVLKYPEPVITEYRDPTKRVMFSPLRDANPFFHLYEALWMLAGKHDAASVSRYAAHMNTFAQDGDLWGAYGWRWRSFFGFDQLAEIIEILRKDPSTRRAVLTMWAPNGDLIPTDAAGSGVWASKDVPCNTHVYFDATGGRLDMTVCNRSNDAVWGAYGANLVHMSVLQEFVALSAGLPLGTYYQFSNNFHIYTDRPDVQRLRDESGVKFHADYTYADGAVATTPLATPGQGMDSWMCDCRRIVDEPTSSKDYVHDFFNDVAAPMFGAHAAYKSDDAELALDILTCARKNSDWIVAAQEWVQRRIDKKAAEAQS